MRNRTQVALVVGLFFLVSAASVYADKPPVSINIMAPGQLRMAALGRSTNVRLIVRMEKHQKNWELNVSCDGIDGGGIYTSTRKSFWNGEGQAEIYDIGFNLSPAAYRCEAILKRKLENGKMKESTSFVEVTVY